MQALFRLHIGKLDRLGTGLLGLCLAAGLNAAPAGALIKPAPVPVNTTHSEFNDDPNFGRDPFFPNSGRRQGSRNPSQDPVVISLTNLKLQGLSGGKDHRLAIINNRTFGVGEEAIIKLDSGPVKVRCLEIREYSVLINANGQNQELSLSQRF